MKKKPVIVNIILEKCQEREKVYIYRERVEGLGYIYDEKKKGMER